KDDDAARLMKLRDRLEMLSAYGRRLAERVETGRYATLHLPAFRERGQAYAMLADGGRGAVDVADVARVWLDEAERFRQVDADWRPAWAARQHGKLAQADRDLEPVRTADHPSARAFGEKSQALAEQVEALLDADMVAGATGALDIRRVDVEREVDEFAAAAARLGQRLAAEALADSWRQDEPLVDPAAAHASATTQAFWARERRRMADYLERSGSIDEARSRLADTRRGLRAMTDPASPTGLPAADLGTPEAVGEPTRRLLTALDEEASRRREETLAQALSSGLPADEAAWAGLRAGFAQQLDDAREIARDALDAERMVRGAWPTGDASLKRRGESPAARVAAWAGSSWASAPAVAQAMGPIAARVDTLRQVEQLVSWSTLARLAQESRDPAVAFAAWRRMAADDSRVEVQEVPWPGTAESLATERLIQSRLLAMAGGVADPERAAALRAEVSGPASAERWRRAMVAAMANQDAAAIGAVAAWAGPMGVEVDTLPAGIRFNVLLSRARQAIAGLEPSGQRGAEVLAVSRAFVREARGLTPDGRADAALERLTALTRPGVKDEQDLASVGPASAGWTAQRSADGRSVTFRRGAWAMTFVRVGREGVQEAEAGGVHYVATTELPVGLALDAVAWAGADAAALWAAMHPAARGGDDMRKGPRTWVKASGIGMTDEQRALRPVTVNSGGWLASPAGGYPAGLTPTPPRATHPINYVSAEGASLLAAALGCRLPTASEWSMSLRLYPPEAERPPNLRDTTWARHARYVAALIAAGTPGVDWADRDVFRPDGQTPRPPTTADHHPFNDGTLWPRPTPTPPPPTPVDLVGNVAELVTDEPIDPSPLLDASRPAAQRRDTFRRAHAEAFAVVGGSALSPASQRPDEAGPFNVYAGARGYADVGLRLAFTAPLTTAAERAERALTGLPFRTQP
ncbi:MAG: SUMF1/EgtB/PvdO family nonheme iron enzyme, partial [Planctomycetota bacterium]